MSLPPWMWLVQPQRQQECVSELGGPGRWISGLSYSC